MALVESDARGLPGAAKCRSSEPYKPKLSLDFVGQPSIGVGADPFGTYAAGGVSFLFSDMLGNHIVGDVGAGDQPVRRVRRQHRST